MEPLLTKKDISLLKEMYSEKLGGPWDKVVGPASRTSEGLNYFYCHDPISLILNVFHDTSFSQAGIMFVKDLANPLEHSTKRLSRTLYVSEIEKSLRVVEELTSLLRSPLHVAAENIHHKPSSQFMIHTLDNKFIEFSFVALVATWRIKIGK